MKNRILLAITFAWLGLSASAQLYSSAAAKLSFFSSTPLENIAAESNTALAVMNASSKELAFIVTNTSFVFQNKLMQEHFNEKYIESEKYPKSSFKGKVNEEIDLSKEGEYKVTVSGKLNIHGVELDRTIPGTIVVKNGSIQLISKFQVKNVDHKIEIPTVVNAKISEAIDVNVDALLLPKK